MIRLRVLGGIDLRDEAGASVSAVLAQPRRLAVLVYLALADRDAPRRRDTILGVFWPERDQESARAALNKTVHFLRRALGADAIVTRGSEDVAVDHDRLWCDAFTFRQMLAAGETATALRSLKGELLPGFFIDSAPAFDEWIERERSALRGEASRAAHSLAVRLEKDGAPTAAIDAARLAVALSVDDERGVQFLIELLDRLGDRAGALQAYDRFAAHLAAEFAAEPSAETRALIGRVRERANEHSAAAVVATKPEHTPRLPVDDGRESRPSPRKRMLRPALAAAGIVVIVASAWFALGTPMLAPTLVPQRLVIAPFVSAVAGLASDSTGISIADHLTAALVQSGITEVVPVPRVSELASGDRTRVTRFGAALARRTGSGVLVRGTISGAPGRVELRAELLRMPDGRVVVVVDPVLAPTVEAATDSLGERLSIAVLAHRDWGDDYGWGRDHRLPRSMDAYRAARLADEASGEAEWAHWRTALAIDPDWPRAMNEGMRFSDSLAREVERLLPTFLEGDADYAQFRLALRAQDHEAGYRAMRRRVAVDSVTWAHPAALMAYWTDRLEDATRHGARRNLSNYWSLAERAYPQPWELYAMVLHSRGRFEEELAVAEEYRARFPQHLGSIVTIEVMAYAGLGKVAELERVLAGAIGLAPSAADSASSYSRAWVAAIELRAHGNVDAGRRVAEFALPWYRERKTQGPLTDAQLDGLIDLLWAAERWDELADAAREQLRRPAAYPYWESSALSLLAIAESRRGRTDSATAALDRLKAGRARWRDGSYEFQLARALFDIGDPVGGMDAFRESFHRGFWVSRSEHTRHRMLPKAGAYEPYRALTKARE